MKGREGNDMTAAEFGGRVSAIRKENKMTRSELASKLNVSLQAISKWENGIGYPDIETIPRLAQIFDTTTDHFYGRRAREQRIFCCCAGGEGELNDKYLTKGWRVIHASISSEAESTWIMVVLERED